MVLDYMSNVALSSTSLTKSDQSRKFVTAYISRPTVRHRPQDWYTEDCNKSRVIAIVCQCALLRRSIMRRQISISKLRATSLGLTGTSFTSLFKQLHLRPSVW